MKKLLILAMLFAVMLVFVASSEGRRAAQPDWYIPLHSDIRPDIDSAGIGEGDFAAGRNSIAYYWDSSNVLQSAVTHVPRFELVGDGTSGSTKWAYLGEPVGVNKLLYCRDFSNGVWTTTELTETQDETGIGGIANTAWTLYNTSAVASRYAVQTHNPANSTDTHCFSVFIKKTSGVTIFPGIQVVQGAVIGAITINTNDGTLTDRALYAPDGKGCDSYGDWWRVWIALTDDGNDHATKVYVMPVVETPTIDGTWDTPIPGSIIADWPQLELDKKFPSSPIGPTLGSEITRATEGGGYPRWSLPDAKSGVSSMFEENLGVEIATGTLTLGNDYKITADTGDDFYTGSAVGEYFTSDGTETCDADSKVQEVTNAWDSMPPHGTIVLRWRPGYARVDTPTGSGILSSSDSSAGLIYTRPQVTRIRSYDGATVAFGSLDFVSDTWYKIAMQYGVLNSNVSQFRIGCDIGAGMVWGSYAAFDGAFAIATHLLLNHTLLGPCHIRDIQGWYRFPSDGEINGLRD